ncbi:triose-phosphate isomerase [Mycoplasma marinum]|uniref:Triosephosphate isomerase n=1 Tax=Mycoplasma marinum TaxID=1937190 RepID=A0A4R0XVZ9_9MOLU|nr:triose-phosphate isomerase [Mycoplasma marinum]TCG11987.1 triose-phosphate isomerase [Mycoplasma marinum]
MRNQIIVGNWKMNKTPAEAKAFMEEFNSLFEQNKDKIASTMKFGIGAPAIDLAVLSETAKDNFIVAAENMHFESNGAFTGELSVEMIKSVGSNAVILGHSERRSMFNETDADVNKKTKVALANGITPIVCVGETLEQYEEGKSKEVVKASTLASLEGITDWANVVIAYEPVWAIGTGKTATSAYAEEMCAYIRSITSEEVLIQYGGSVKPGNVEELMAQPNVDGALVGGASVQPESFIKLLTLNK